MAEETLVGGRLRFLGYGACALAGCLWGTGFYFGRLALNEMSVESMVLYRFLFASLGMLPVMLFYRGGWVRLTRAEVRMLLIASSFGVPIQFLLQFHGLARTTVSHASLMVGAMPVMLAVAAAIFAGEKLDSPRLGRPLRLHGGRGARHPWRQAAPPPAQRSAHAGRRPDGDRSRSSLPWPGFCSAKN